MSDESLWLLEPLRFFFQNPSFLKISLPPHFLPLSLLLLLPLPQGMYKCVCICVCSHAHGSEERVSTPLDYTEQANGFTCGESIMKAGDSGFRLRRKKLLSSEMKRLPY